jgi:putative ABC transport system permease protein
MTTPSDRKPQASDARPPAAASWLLRRMIPADAQDAVIGDLDEEFAERMVSRAGAAGARRWYWSEALSLVKAYTGDRLRSAATDHKSHARADNMRHDLRDALRTLMRSPSYSLITIAVLALGIGATSAIFSFVDGVLLRPLPYANPERIVRVFEKPPGALRNSISTANFLDWQRSSDVFETLVATTNTSMSMTGTSEARRIRASRVSAGYFDVFGAKPALGRTFARDEDQLGKHHVAVISHRLWESTFGADPAIIGRTITLDREPYTVIGVMPAGSVFDRGWPDLIRPLAFAANEQARNFHWLQALGKLKPGVTIEQARAQLDPIAARIARDYPDSNRDWGITIDSFQELAVNTNLRQSLRVLMSAVAMLLLVGCANLANLALARGTAREREILVRAALGASRRRLVQQFLTESLLLALAGGALGIAVGYGMMRGLQMLLPPLFLPREALVTLDWRAVSFALTTSIVTGLFFGTFPAIQAGRLDLAGSMRGSARTVTADRFRRRLRDGLVVVEVALACTLLVGAGLLMRSFMRLQQVEATRNPETLLTASLAAPNNRFENDDQARAYHRLLVERSSALPGVTDVALATALPLQGWGYGMPLRVPGIKPGDAPVKGGGGFKMVTPPYFRTVGLPILRGRPLQDTDTASSTRVLVINQAFASRFFQGVDPIGRQILIETILAGKPQLGPEVPWEVVGIAGNERIGNLSGGDSAGVYASLEQSPVFGPSIVLRTSGDAAAVTASLKAAIREIDPDQPVGDVRTMAAIRAESVAPDRLRTWLIVLFAVTAALLAAIGVYGVISYSVAQRTHEIGVRAALGASRGRLMGLVMRRATILTTMGLIGGVAGAWWSSRLLESLLFGIAARDIATLAGAALTLGIVAMIAAWVPARRAAAVDPLIALRTE